nr:trace amine-associated receptor 1-like [Pocillopora verrucosa]
MVFSQVLAGIHAVINLVGLPGNLLVIATICMESRFHAMRYVLLASLAGSDILFLILGNSPSIASIAQERWLYGETMCKLHYLVLRYFYLNTVLHLVAVSYERYNAIVKSPLTYDSSITRSKVVVIVLIWTVPVLVCTITFFKHGGTLLYYPKLFFCKAATDAPAFNAPAPLIVFFVPISIIFFLNWRLLKTVNSIQSNDQPVVFLESTAASYNNGPSQHQQHEARRIKDRKAAFDVCIIIAAFVICFLPEWTDFVLRNYFTVEFPPEVTQTTRCIYYISSVTNPIIYSVRKREFRGGVKRTLKRIGGLCAVLFPSGTDNAVGAHGLRQTPTGIPSIVESRAAQVAQQKDSLDSRTLNVPKRIEMNFQGCHHPTEEIAE